MSHGETLEYIVGWHFFGPRYVSSVVVKEDGTVNLFDVQELQVEVVQDLNKMNLVELENKLSDMEVKIVV